MDENKDPFLVEQRDAYISLIAVIIQGVLNFSDTQFKANASWILPLISDIIINSNGTLRQCVKDIFDKHIQSIVLYS